MGIPQVAEELLQVVLVRIGVSVKAEEIDVEGRSAGGYRAIERRAKSVLVGVEEDVGAVVLVVAAREEVVSLISVDKSQNLCPHGTWETYSRAQRYGSRARIFGRAQVSRLKGDMVGYVSSECDESSRQTR